MRWKGLTMTRTPIEKLLGRVGHLKAQAKLADARDVAHLRDFPTVTLKQIVLLDQRDEVGGVYKKHVYQDFRSALAQHQVKRLRAYAGNCRRHARALRKLATNYVYRPGYTEAELKAR